MLNYSTIPCDIVVILSLHMYLNTQHIAIVIALSIHLLDKSRIEKLKNYIFTYYIWMFFKFLTFIIFLLMEEVNVLTGWDHWQLNFSFLNIRESQLFLSHIWRNFSLVLAFDLAISFLLLSLLCVFLSAHRMFYSFDLLFVVLWCKVCCSYCPCFSIGEVCIHCQGHCQDFLLVFCFL